MNALDKIEQCRAEIKKVYRYKLDSVDSREKRSADQAAALHFSIAAAQRHGADDTSLQRIYGVDSFYLAAVREVYGK